MFARFPVQESRGRSLQDKNNRSIRSVRKSQISRSLVLGSVLTSPPTPPLLFQSNLNQYTCVMGLASLQSAISKYYNMRYELRGGVGGKTAIAPENVMVRDGTLAHV